MTAPAHSAQSKVGLPIVEAFGPTWQGEGPHAGRRCGFVRLGYCNLECSWCDTPYSWDSKRHDLSEEITWSSDPGAVVSAALPGPHHSDLLVISGGEPLLWKDRPEFRGLLQCSQLLGADVHIETNGTISPEFMGSGMVDHYSVSPKLPNAGMTAERTIKPDVIAEFGQLAEEGAACLKFVCSTVGDVLDVGNLMATEGFSDFPVNDVWIMPEGTTTAAVINTARRIADAVLGEGFNLTLRQHVLLFGSERAR